MSRVIAAVDDSAAAAAVLAMARAVGEVLAADVDAVNVGGGGGTAAAAAARADVPFRTLTGEPLPTLVALGDEDDVVSFVVGQRNRVRSGTTGHTALGIADAVVQPVVVVPPDAAVPDRIRRVLVAMEGTPARARQLRRALSLASSAAELEVVVVHVDDEGSLPMFSDHAGYDTEAYAAEFLTRYAPGIPVTRLELRVGPPVEEILRTCDVECPDLLAMGWPHHGRPGGGQVARQVLERATTPVLLVATV